MSHTSTVNPKEP